MNSETPGVVKMRSRYARRVSSVDGISNALNRFSMVGALSSAARIPLPGATRDRAVSASSPRFIAWRLPVGFRSHLKDSRRDIRVSYCYIPLNDRNPPRGGYDVAGRRDDPVMVYSTVRRLVCPKCRLPTAKC